MPNLGHLTGNRKTEAPCRTCTDFKTWARQQREIMEKTVTTTDVSIESSTGPTMADKYGCPYDRSDLGKATWGFLHTMAAKFPENPTPSDQSDMSKFFDVLSKFYPCEFCAKDLQQEIQIEPVEASSQNAFKQWLCRLHNKVNIKIGKPEFDCSLVDERWKYGWKDGSCD